MNRDDVRRMLRRATGEAIPTCLATLEQPGSELDADDILTHSAPTSSLAAIYGRRARHVAQIGLPTVGFDEAAARLAACEHDRLRMVLITGVGGHPWCVIFVAPHDPDVVAALAVLGPMPPA